jgi:hypothetical protein
MGPLRPYRVEISTCIRLQHRPPLLLYFVLFLYYQRKESLTTFLCFYTCVGKESLVVDEGVREPSEFGSAVNGVFVREVPLAAAAWATSFGTILCGLETMRSAWPTLEHVFSVRVGNSAQGAAAVSEPGLVFSGSRYPLGLLKANPVDLLVIERGALVKPSSLGRPERWEDMIDATPVSSRPKMVFESWPGVAVTWASGPSGKAYVTRWTKRGYATTMRLVSAVQVVEQWLRLDSW